MLIISSILFVNDQIYWFVNTLNVKRCIIWIKSFLIYAKDKKQNGHNNFVVIIHVNFETFGTYKTLHDKRNGYFFSCYSFVYIRYKYTHKTLILISGPWISVLLSGWSLMIDFNCISNFMSSFSLQFNLQFLFYWCLKFYNNIFIFMLVKIILFVYFVL